MFRRSLFYVVFALCVSSTFTLSAATISHAETYTINAVAGWPETSFETQQFITFLTLMQDEADAKYPGELKLNYKGAGEVIHSREQVEALRSGLIEMVFTAGSYYTSVVPEIDTMSLTQLRPWEERAAGLNDYMEKIHNKKANAHYLGRVGSGSLFHMFLNKPVNTIADLDGKKLRSSPTNIPLLKSVGATPISMPPPDVYTAMERGVVDGFILPPATIRDFGLIKPSKYMIFPGFYEPVQFLLVNLDAWKALPKHLQELLDNGAQELAHYAIANITKHNLDEQKDFLKQGMIFTHLSAEETAKFSKMAADALYKVVSKKAPVESKMILEMITKK
ncbi:MAG: TRAP transporter substrate-binding protein DctP [Desulfuromusa sp.]|nr:TRAP transporter substrate-binding protein DctP [Desulfuromusa sp.]